MSIASSLPELYDMAYRPEKRVSTVATVLTRTVRRGSPAERQTRSGSGPFMSASTQSRVTLGSATNQTRSGVHSTNNHQRKRTEVIPRSNLRLSRHPETVSRPEPAHREREGEANRVEESLIPPDDNPSMLKIPLATPEEAERSELRMRLDRQAKGVNGSFDADLVGWSDGEPCPDLPRVVECAPPGLGDGGTPYDKRPNRLCLSAQIAVSSMPDLALPSTP